MICPGASTTLGGLKPQHLRVSKVPLPRLASFTTERIAWLAAPQQVNRTNSERQHCILYRGGRLAAAEAYLALAPVGLALRLARLPRLTGAARGRGGVRRQQGQVRTMGSAAWRAPRVAG